ncbi:hypothetical protein O181_097207 [Austropuccinia psidii MF-1]|uniref:Uncharacterized protein n=1 Tax=Austropuccinia psidii MF-1 TaxID=1389203 RepID=A0A9Q3J8T4_9BASI|nr:hypothetical protein [Austropuccinia psidii MF-1]
MHIFSAAIQWLFPLFIRSSRHIIQRINQGSRASVKPQIPMMPSSSHLLFSFTVFLQGNTGSSFSRDIQEAVSKQLVKGQFSTNPPWQPHSLNTVWIHKDLYFIHTTWEDHSTQFTSQFGKVYIPSNNQYSFQYSIQVSCQPEGAKLNFSHIPASSDPGEGCPPVN